MIFFLSLAFYIDLNAQEKDFVPNFIPPSPTAYELGKYGQIPIGMFTGTPNISIPLYEYKTKNLSVPISLSYSSNGIKVDQIETNVGQSWSLNAGGVITRIVRGKPDEQEQSYFPEQDIATAGVQSPMAIQYFYNIGNSNGELDSETDLFMFNFKSHSGKFVYDHHKKIILIPYQDLKIEPYSELDNLGQERLGFRITTSDGINYYFLDDEQTIYRTSNAGHSTPETQTTAWYLSRIEHPTGDKIEFVYDSQGYEYVSSQSETLDVIFPDGQRGCSGQFYGGYTYATILNHSQIRGKVLKEIKSNNPYSGRLNFESTFQHPDPDLGGYKLINAITVSDKDNNIVEQNSFQYITTSNYRVFLSKITFKDPSKNYQFDYINSEGLPKRLSFSQDHWGYYNGQQNTHLVPHITDHFAFMLRDGANKEVNSTVSMNGILRKVIYPTKGYNLLEYEQNSYYGSKVIPAHGTSIDLEAITPDEFGSSYDQVQTIHVGFNQTLSVNVVVNFNIACDTTLNTGFHTAATLTVKNLQTNEILNFSTRNSSGIYIPREEGNLFSPGGIHNNCFLTNVPVGDYEVKLHPTYQCVFSSAHLSYYDQPETTIQANIETGGIRIKRVTAHDPVQNIDNVTRYYYGPMNNLTQFSADEGQKAYYISNSIERFPCIAAGEHADIEHVILSSSSLTNLFNTGSNNIYYPYVTLSQGGDNFENGGEEHEFILHRDSPGNSRWGEDIKGAPWTNFGWDNGLEKNIKVFKKDASNGLVVLNETNNHYKTDERNYSEVSGFSVRKKFEMVLGANPVYTCTDDDVTSKTIDFYCSTDHVHSWYLGEPMLCIARNANNTFRFIYHPCYGLAPYTVITLPQNLSNLDITEYKNLSYWNYLDSTATKQYDINGENPVTTTTRYFYDNPSHIQLTRTETTGSDGKTITTKTHYPDDDLTSLGFTSTQNQLIKRLGGGENGLHRIAEAVQTEQMVDGNITSTQRTLYKDWVQNGDTLILPEIIQTSTRGSSLENRARYKQYDEHGNPLEVSKENDVVSSYYWGYGYRFPVVKADNISYNILATAIQNSLPASFTSLDALLDVIVSSGASDSRWTLFNRNLRANSSLSGRMITTYTFSPMIGITSQTDPNGITTYYEYDSFGRLYQIKDHEGNILKRYDYNYKQP